MAAHVFVAVAIALTNIQLGQTSRGFQRLYSPMAITNYSKLGGQLYDDERPISNPNEITKSNLKKYTPAYKGRTFIDKNFVQIKQTSFKGFKYGVPKWGLVMSSNNFTKISKSKRLKNVEVVPMYDDQVEIIVDSDTLQTLFEEEDKEPFRDTVDSETDLSDYNDTQLIGARVETEEEPKKGCINVSKKNRRIMWFTSNSLLLVILILIVMAVFLKPSVFFPFH